MKKLLLSGLFMMMAPLSFASHANKMWMKKPVSTWQNYPAGLKDVDIAVTPMGAYAQIDLTFSIGPTSNPSPTDSQEAVIFFDLPANSYVHDSWLWLDNSLAVPAQLVERKKAIEVYSGIVKRRKDPSILYNPMPEAYQLNIYPVTTNFWRKVKISYSTPILFRSGNALVPLPTDLLGASATPTAFNLTVNTGTLYDNPSFSGRAFGSWLVSQTGNSYVLNIPATAYATADLNMSFHMTQASGAILMTKPTDPSEGYYELVSMPQPATAPARYYNLIIDFKATSNYDLYTAAEIQRSVGGWLSSMLGPADYFNIYYRTTTGATALFNSWHAADSTGIAAIATAFTGAPAANEADYMGLLIAGMNFTKSKPGAETILISGNNPSSSSSQSSLFNLVKGGAGPFSNKLHVVNFHYSVVSGTTGPYHYGSAAINGMLSQLADSTRGSYTAPTSNVYDTYTSSYLYNFNLKDALRAVPETMTPGTSSFQLDIPMTGFTYGEYATNRSARFQPSGVYTEIGHYYGTFTPSDSIRFNYKLGNAYGTASSALTITAMPGHNQNKTWNYFNNRELAAYGSAYRQEVIDSSINNRVLSDFTAFLALDIRDTVNKSQNLNVKNPTTAQSGTITAYPNPFRTTLTIESKQPIEMIQIFSIEGKLLKSNKTTNVLKWTWDGKDNAGNIMPAGVYIVRVSSSGSSTALRITKID
jgi:hypothetical protein